MLESFRLVERSKSLDPVVMATRLLWIKGMILREAGEKKVTVFSRRMRTSRYFYPHKTEGMK